MEIVYSRGLKAFSQKPPKKERKGLRFEGGNQSIHQLINEVENGYSFMCATFQNDRRATKGFIMQQLVGLDFDSGMPINEAVDRLKDFGIPFTFGYPTFSHTPDHPRFRLIIALDGYITDANLALDINQALFNCFSDSADESCVDLPRVWFGTNRSCFLGDTSNYVNTMTFLQSLHQRQFASKHKKWDRCFRLDCVIHDFCPNIGNVYRYNSNSNFETNSTPSIKNVVTPKKVEKPDWELLANEFEIFRRFYNGEGGYLFKEKLSHRELFGLYTNMAPISGGAVMFKKLLDKNSHYNKDKYSIPSYVGNQYAPMLIGIFSQADRDKPYQTFVQALRKRGWVKKLPNQPKLLTLQEAEQELVDAFKSIEEDNGNNIYLVRCVPGLGKSEYIKNLPGVVVAFPNHALLQEQFGSSKLTINQKIATPDLKGRFSKDIERRFLAYYNSGWAANVMIEIQRLANGDRIAEEQSEKDVLAAKEFLLELAQAHIDSNQTVFTTHIRALHQDWEQSTICFDESPLNFLFEKDSVRREEIEGLMGVLTAKGIKTGLLKEFLSKVRGADEVQQTPTFFLPMQQVYEICAIHRINSRVAKFLLSTCYFVDNDHIHFCIDNRNCFHPDKKYIICDATGSKDIYEKVFGCRLKVVDMSNVEYKGRINQYTAYSCSSSRIEETVQKLKIDQSLPTITFKDKKPLFHNPCKEMHFGRSRGSNALAGKDINVVGTFHYNVEFYRFIDYVLQLGNRDWSLKKMDVEFGGLAFSFRTFENEGLRNIHLQTVHAEELQTVHRSRILRYDCVVHLYSNFPLAQANYIY